MSISRRRLFGITGSIVAVAAVILTSAVNSPVFAKGAPPKPAPKPAPAKPAPTKPPDTPKPKDLIETLTESTDPAFKTLLDALKAADLTTTLKGKGPFTLFAPTDDAFKKLADGTLADWMKPANKAALKGILSDHYVASKMMAADLAKAKTVKTAGGHTLDVKIGDDKAWVGILDSKASKSDVVVANGVIHFMDAVIQPKADPPKGTDPAGMADPAMK